MIGLVYELRPQGSLGKREITYISGSTIEIDRLDGESRLRSPERITEVKNWDKNDRQVRGNQSSGVERGGVTSSVED